MTTRNAALYFLAAAIGLTALIQVLDNRAEAQESRAARLEITSGARLSADDRETCKTAAYAAVLGMMKGGTPPLPASCAAVIKAVRTEFSYYASNYLYTDDRGLAELLAVLAIRYSPSGASVSRRPITA